MTDTRACAHDKTLWRVSAMNALACARTEACALDAPTRARDRWASHHMSLRHMCAIHAATQRQTLACIYATLAGRAAARHKNKTQSRPPTTTSASRTFSAPRPRSPKTRPSSHPPRHVDRASFVFLRRQHAAPHTSRISTPHTRRPHTTYETLRPVPVLHDDESSRCPRSPPAPPRSPPTLTSL